MAARFQSIFVAVMWTTCAWSIGCSTKNSNTQEPAATVDVGTEQIAVASSTTSAAPSASAKPAAKGETLFVAEALVDCVGEGPMKCMRVRARPDAEWSLFYDSIEGFEYEEGYRYELRVEVTSVSDPPADASSKRHRLLEIVSKEAVPKK